MDASLLNCPTQRQYVLCAVDDKVWHDEHHEYVNDLIARDEHHHIVSQAYLNVGEVHLRQQIHYQHNFHNFVFVEDLCYETCVDQSHVSDDLHLEAWLLHE